MLSNLWKQTVITGAMCTLRDLLKIEQQDCNSRLENINKSLGLLWDDSCGVAPFKQYTWRLIEPLLVQGEAEKHDDSA